MNEELEKLKQLKEQLLDETQKWQQMEETLEDTQDFSEGRGKAYKIGSHPGTGGLSFEDDKEKGKLNIFMLCIITLVMQILFLSISYFIYK